MIILTGSLLFLESYFLMEEITLKLYSVIFAVLFIMAAYITLEFINDRIKKKEDLLSDELFASYEEKQRVLTQNKKLSENIELKRILNTELKNEIKFCETVLDNLSEIVLVTNMDHEIVYSNKYFNYFSEDSISKHVTDNRNYDYAFHLEKEREMLSNNDEVINFNHQDFFYKKCVFDMNNDKYILTIGEDLRELNLVNKKLVMTINQLKNTDDDLNIINDKFNQLLDFISNIDDFKNIQIDSFLINVFNFMFTLIEKATSGSVYNFKDGYVNFLDAHGHDLKKLQSITIYAEDFDFDNRKGILISKNILDTSKEYFKKQLIDACEDIKETLSFYIYINDEPYGAIALDISKDSDAIFNEEDVQIIKPIEKLLNNIIYIVSQREVHEKFTDDILNSFMELISIHSTALYRHSKNVADFSRAFAEFLGYDLDFQKEVYWSGLMHDVGFLSVPKEELDRDYNSEKYYRNHVTDAYRVMSEIDGLENVAKNIYCHHEHFDGTGYPNGISGSDIPMASQIISLINYYDFIVHIHQESYFTLFEKLEEKRNKTFSANLIDQFIKWVGEYKNVQ